jgi:hypothetical protein
MGIDEDCVTKPNLFNNLYMWAQIELVVRAGIPLGTLVQLVVVVVGPAQLC